MSLKRFGIAGLIIALIASVVAAAYFAGIFPGWTGFDPPLLDAQGHEVPHAKTLWDWLQLLLVPLVIAGGGYLFTRAENDRLRKLQDQREAEARNLETERAREVALQAYLDRMTQLLLHEKLRTSQPHDEVRSVARTHTLTTLRVLDGVRKATIVHFLYEANLIGGSKQEKDGVPETIDLVMRLDVANLRGANLSRAHLFKAKLFRADLFRADLFRANLGGADLRGANLFRANLIGADLRGANLFKANLRGAYLFRANLEGANLEGANLEEADLEKANLIDSIVTSEQLAQAYSLEGAKLSVGMAPPAPMVEVNAPKDQTRKPERGIEL